MMTEESKQKTQYMISNDALRLHSQSIVVDGHVDTLLELVNGKIFNLKEKNTISHVDIPRMIEGGINVQIFAAFIEPAYKPERSLKRTLQMISRFYKEITANADYIAPVLRYNDIEDAISHHKIAAVLSIEGGEAISGDLDVLYTLYRLGVRAIGLTWNERNDIAEGVGEKTSNGGLTAFGHQVIKEMNHLGMIVDVSHLNEKSFWDVVEISDKPIIASHSNAYTKCPHVRNLKDDQILALAKNGGVMGMNFAPPFIHPEQADVYRLVDHIDYIVQLVGPDHVGLGSDFDGIPSTPDGLDDVARMPLITQVLIDRGYSNTDIQKILGGNFLRIMKNVLK